MYRGLQRARIILKRLGKVRWSNAEDTFVIEAGLGVVLRVRPNSDEDIVAGLHIDEITVAEGLRGRGAAEKRWQRYAAWLMNTG